MSWYARVLVFGGLFLLGFAGVGALLYLRAPAPATHDSQLASEILVPDGYVALDDVESGGGTLSERTAATLLGVDTIPQYADGLLRAYGRPPGQPPQAVVVLVVQTAQADELMTRYVTAATARGATPFTAPSGMRGITEQPDDAHRVARRVVFARNERLFVVSLVNPDTPAPVADVVALARAQYAGPAPANA